MVKKSDNKKDKKLIKRERSRDSLIKPKKKKV